MFDTNSLWNFAVVERLDILGVRYGTRACWTDTVFDEVRVSEAWEPRLAQLHACTWLGNPLELSRAACLTDVAGIQRILAAPGDPPSKNLGESECIHIIEHELSRDAWFVTDDAAAADLARKRGIRVLGTTDVLVECHYLGELPCPDPFDLLVQMSAEGRANIKVPNSHKEVCP